MQAPSTAAGLARSNPSRRAASRDGLLAGTIIFTLEGALPVEYLEEGDRVITRAGMRPLRRIERQADGSFALGFDGPQVIYADGQEVAA